MCINNIHIICLLVGFLIGIIIYNYKYKKMKKNQADIKSYANFKKYTIDIAKGKHKLKNNEPKIWFEKEYDMDKKCNFCDSKAISVTTFIVETKPDNIDGFPHYDYFQKEIYTCDKHVLNCDRIELNEG